MTQHTSPHDDAPAQASEALWKSAMSVGVVTSAPTTDEDGQHHVAVQHTRVPSDEQIPVIPTVHGDYYIPPEDTPVLVGRFWNGEYAVIGAPIPEVPSPTIEAGERIVSHPGSGSTVRFHNDGTLDVYADDTVRLNDGSTGVVTDVTTTTDADGHVTSISLTRASNVFVP